MPCDDISLIHVGRNIEQQQNLMKSELKNTYDVEIEQNFLNFFNNNVDISVVIWQHNASKYREIDHIFFIKDLPLQQIFFPKWL